MLQTYMHTYIPYKYTYTHICTYIHTYIHTLHYIHADIHTCIHTHTYIHVHDSCWHTWLYLTLNRMAAKGLKKVWCFCGRIFRQKRLQEILLLRRKIFLSMSLM